MQIPVSEFEALHDRIRELQAKETEGIDHAVYEMVCEERDVLERRLAKVDAVVEMVSDGRWTFEDALEELERRQSDPDWIE